MTAPFHGVRRQPVPVASADRVRPVAPERPLPWIVGPHGDVDLAGWARANAATVDRWLHQHGAVLFRGFGVAEYGFAKVAQSLVGASLSYRERSSPRTEIGAGVYTSTEHPADQWIALHNENSYQHTLPARLVFGCVVAPETGGETPLADCRNILNRLDQATVAAFRQRQVRYVRNYSPGLGLSWQEAFQETDPARVDEYCRSQGITTTWGPDDRLRTEQVRPAIAVHPVTNREVWCNHAAFFHISAVAADLRTALLEQFGEAGVPANAFYGDGGPIDAATLAEIRTAYRAETVAVPWRQGDVLLVDNLLVAHGRAPFTGPRRIVVSMGGTTTHHPSSTPVAEPR
jgi:alpha-ketoglutarate-dependent taurine dioxygenase